MAAILMAWPVAAQSVPTYRLPVVAEVGGEMGRIEAITADTTGRIFILDSDPSRVIVADPTGRRTGILGRAGSGPGEMNGPVGMTWGPAGGLWVIDPANARVAIWPSGHGPPEHRPLPSAMQLAPWPGRFDRQGRLHHYEEPRAAGGEFDFQMAIFDGRTLRRLGVQTPPAAPAPESYFVTPTQRYGTLRARVPFSPRLIWRLNASGTFVWAWTAEGAIHRGTSILVPALPGISPAPVSAMERADALDALQRFVSLGGRIDQGRIPRLKPLMRDFWLDDEDRIWIVPELAGDRTGTVLELFSATGRHLARLELPRRIESSPRPEVRNGRLYAAHLTELGEPSVVVFALPATHR